MSTCKQVVDGRDRPQLKRLCRYITRPPISLERLELRADGRYEVRLKTPWKDGTRALLFEPHELLSRLVAAIPAPRFHMFRYFGVLSSHSKLRRQVVPIRPTIRRATRPRRPRVTSCPCHSPPVRASTRAPALPPAESGGPGSSGIVEVLPASVARLLGMPGGYKGNSDEARGARERLVGALAKIVSFDKEESRQQILDDPEGDAMDAVLAGLAALRAHKNEFVVSHDVNLQEGSIFHEC